MGMSEKTGENFAVSPRSITLFGLRGSFTSPNWAIGVNFSTKNNGEPSYVMVEVSPAPVINDLLEVIEQDKANGNFEQIQRVVVSSRVAVRLFLDGTLKPSDFDGTEEGMLDTSPFLEDGVERPVLILKPVKIGAYSFPLLILSEMHVGDNTFATLNKSNAIV